MSVEPPTSESLRSLIENGPRADLEVELVKQAALALEVASKLHPDEAAEDALRRIGTEDLTETQAEASELAYTLAATLPSWIERDRTLGRARGNSRNLELDFDLASSLAGQLARELRSGPSRSRPTTLVRRQARGLGRSLRVTERRAAQDRPYNDDSGLDHDISSSIELFDRVVSIIYALVAIATAEDSSEDDRESTDRSDDGVLGEDRQLDPTIPLDGLVDLAIEPHTSPDRAAPLMARLEVLLSLADRAIDQGLFDSSPELLRVVERDCAFLRAEAYETPAPFALGETLGAILARLEDNLLSVIEVPDSSRAVLNDVIAATTSDDPAAVPEVLESVLQAARLDDPDQALDRHQLETFQGELDVIQEVGSRQWLASALGWYRSDRAEAIRAEAGTGASVGAAIGGAVGLIVAAFTNATIGNAATIGAGSGGVAAAILGASIAWFVGRYGPKQRDD